MRVQVPSSAVKAPNNAVRGFLFRKAIKRTPCSHERTFDSQVHRAACCEMHARRNRVGTLFLLLYYWTYLKTKFNEVRVNYRINIGIIKAAATVMILSDCCHNCCRDF